MGSGEDRRRKGAPALAPRSPPCQSQVPAHPHPYTQPTSSWKVCGLNQKGLHRMEMDTIQVDHAMPA